MYRHSRGRVETVMRNIVIGTAGHIDHGKSTLIRTLTGTDPDRWQEEKRRGITLDLGFASLTEGNIHISFVDVPGHESLVRQMIAGAVGFDAAILAVDAREGVMPQTREHIFILQVLGVRRLLAAITRCDLATADEIQSTITDIELLLHGTPFAGAAMVQVSVHNASSVDQLKQAIVRMAAETPERPAEGAFLMRIDRCFTLKGFGTVVTGTAVSGTVRKGDTLRLFPAEKDVRVKGVSVHGNMVESAHAGMRVALNLPDATLDETARGAMLSTPGALSSTVQMFVRLHTAEDLPKGARIRHNRTYPIFIGTEQVAGRIILPAAEDVTAGKSSVAEIRLERPYSPHAGEPFLIRGLSPQTTIAGGTVLAVSSFHLKRKEMPPLLELLLKQNHADALRLITAQGCTLLPPPLSLFGLTEQSEEALFSSCGIALKERYAMPVAAFDRICQDALNRLSREGTLALDDTGKMLPPVWRKELEKEILKRAKGNGYQQNGRMLEKPAVSPFEQLAADTLMLMEQDPALSNPQVLAEKTGKDEATMVKVVQYLHNREKIRPLDKNLYVAQTTVKRFFTAAEKTKQTHGTVSLQTVKEHFPAPRKILFALMTLYEKK